MPCPGALRHKTVAVVLAGALAAALPLAAWADTRSRPTGARTHSGGYRHPGYHYRSDALIGGVFGGAILGLTLGALARPYGPPQYVYVDPPPAYYVPPPVPPYPPVPVYPAPDPYAAPGYYYAPAPVPPAQTAAQRLEELQEACKRGLMSKQECDAKRKAIIEGM
jgi:hypothetical protein